MSPEDLKNLPNEEQLLQAVEATKTAKKAQQVAEDLKKKASLTSDPGERDNLLEEARRKEGEANFEGKKANRLASGAWQGAARGAGIGTAVGAGLGAVVGTVVGTVTSIPTAGLGALVGVPVGMIHGPWIDPNEMVPSGEKAKKDPESGANKEEK